MRGAGVEPSPDTYVTLLNAYGEKGDLESMKKVCAYCNKCLISMASILKRSCIFHLPWLTFSPTFTPPCFSFPIPHFTLQPFQTLEAAESADCSLMDRDIMQVILTLAKAGQQQHIPEMIERLRHERGYIPGRRKEIYVMFSDGNKH